MIYCYKNTLDVLSPKETLITFYKNNFKTTLTYNFRLLKFFKNKYSG